MKKLSIFALLFAVIFMAGCSMPPKTFRKTYDEPGIWKVVDVRQGMEKNELWRMLVDTLSQKYDLEVLEKDSGYLRTSWKYTQVSQFGNVSDRYRSRIVIKLIGSNWSKIQVKCESNWLSKRGWLMGYDTRLLEDVFGDIQGRVGRVRR